MTLASGWKAVASSGAIATLVFFPLLNALAVDHGYWLHWRTQDTLETLGAWVLVGCFAFATTALPRAFRRPECAAAANAVWLLIGGFFATGALVKIDAIRDVVAPYRDASPWISAVMLTLCLCLAAASSRRWRQLGWRSLERITLGLSPLIVVFLLQLGAAQWYHRTPPAGHGNQAAPAAPGKAVPSARNARLRTLVLLFDELSPDYLYGVDAAGALDGLPALKRLIGESTIHAGAFLPGGQTKVAIPSLFALSALQGADMRDRRGRMFSDEVTDQRPGWVGEAARRRLDVRVFGWHLDYCTSLAAFATECRAVSLYNRRTLDPDFSFLHPLLTTLSLLPADIPFGWLKDRPAVAMHRGTYRLAGAWMKQQLADPRADVIFVHVNVPHVPLLADGLIGRERFVVGPAQYQRQLCLVDAFVAVAMTAIQGEASRARPTRVVVLSDHNARSLTPPSAHERVVFMVRQPDGRDAGRDEQRASASALLATVLATSK